MNMNIRILSTVTILLALIASPALAQTERLNWRVRIYGGELQLPEARTYLLFTPVTELKVTVAVQNEGEEPIALNLTDFAGAITAELLESGRTVGSGVTWEPTIRLLPGIEIVPIVPGDHQLLPQSAVEWTGVLKLEGGALKDGEYQVVIDIRAAIARGLAKADGDPWVGRASPQTSLTLQVRSPKTTADIARSERIRGQRALSENRSAEALGALLKAAAISPKDASIASQVGRAHLQQRNFQEAIVWFERALSLQPRRHRSPIPERLAFAYLGNNDEQNAIRVLRSVGKSENQMKEDIARMRRALAQPGR
jgi:tetratricopeptide (TPR) repeat protein